VLRLNLRRGTAFCRARAKNSPNGGKNLRLFPFFRIALEIQYLDKVGRFYILKVTTLDRVLDEIQVVPA
jgi:hypothetical protein